MASSTPASEGPPADSRPLPFLPDALAHGDDCGAFVAVVRDADSFSRWLAEDDGALQWIEVHGLLDDTEVWRRAARIKSDVPLDIVMADPAAEYARLYRLVDLREVRPVRVTIPVVAGFLKALRLAASIQLPVRLLPGQPDVSEQAELEEAAEFYLRDPMVEAPVDYFHSVLASLQAEEPGRSLWMALEADPAAYLHHDAQGRPELLRGGGPVADPATHVRDHVARVAAETECGDCRWLGFCQGFFKYPDAGYSCQGVIRVFEKLESAAEEMRADLSSAPLPGADEEGVSKEES